MAAAFGANARGFNHDHKDADTVVIGRGGVVDVVYFNGVKGFNIKGTLWAEFNVGATSDEDAGKFFTWQEARTACPEGWRLPTVREFETLTKVDNDWITVKGTQGRRFYDQTIYPVFFPAAGPNDMGGTYSPSPKGAYWSADPAMDESYALILFFNADGARVWGNVAEIDRMLPVRCVRPVEAEKVKAVVVNGTKGVRINGVVWAPANVDAPAVFARDETDAGMFYQWNRSEGWSTTDPLRSSEGGSKWNSKPEGGKRFSSLQDPCPAGWRIPKPVELASLDNRERVFSEWVRRGDAMGRQFTDIKTGESIFLPAAGARNVLGIRYFEGLLGYYWSRRRISDREAASLLFNDEGMNPVNEGNVVNGYNIRCVKK